MALIDTMSITEYEVEIHAYGTGRWEIALDGKSLGSGDTLDKAKTQARTALAKRKVKVDVPFITRDGKRGSAYAIHAKSGKPMVEIDGEKTEWTSYGASFKPSIPPETLDDYLDASQKAEAAKKVMRRIETEWDLNLMAATRAAIEDAAQATVTESAA